MICSGLLLLLVVNLPLQAVLSPELQPIVATTTDQLLPPPI